MSLKFECFLHTVLSYLILRAINCPRRRFETRFTLWLDKEKLEIEITDETFNWRCSLLAFRAPNGIEKNMCFWVTSILIVSTGTWTSTWHLLWVLIVYRIRNLGFVVDENAPFVAVKVFIKDNVSFSQRRRSYKSVVILFQAFFLWKEPVREASLVINRRRFTMFLSSGWNCKLQGPAMTLLSWKCVLT